MLSVQKFLREGGTLQQLHEKLGIRVVEHPTDPLVILNYCQIDSPKRDPICVECRGLVLEQGSWDVIARSFPRFFNYGEYPDLDAEFDWADFTANTKEDGSLALVYEYGGRLRMNTRGSFAQGGVVPGIDMTWEQLFWKSVAGTSLSELCGIGRSTYVFELCSPYNRVVRRYPEPTAFLLTVFDNETGEMSPGFADAMAKALDCGRPTALHFRSIDEVYNFLLAKADDPTFEGVVLRDSKNRREKVKSALYVALHHLHDNGNVCNVKRLLPLYLANEQDEVLTHFEEVTPHFLDMVESLEGEKARMLAVWARARHLPSQKEFALYVKKHTRLAAVLFEARKKGSDPVVEFNKAEGVLLKYLEGKL